MQQSLISNDANTNIPMYSVTPAAAFELRLEVRDPDVIFELTKRSVPEERVQFALTALRIGVLSLRSAGGELDATSLKNTGEKLIGDIRDLLTARAKDLTNGIATSLTRYFDPSTGLLSQKLERLVANDGDLARVLKQHLGADDSALARTLAGYLGQQSPVFSLLSPTDANGIRAQLEQTLRQALLEQRTQILQQFSLDSKDSALSRLVHDMQEIQEQLNNDFSAQAEKIKNEFSLDKPDSALCRLVCKVESAQRAISDQFSSDNEQSVMNRFAKLLTNTNAIIDKNLTLDNEQSALSRLKREIQGGIDSLIAKNESFHGEVRETLARFASRNEEAIRSTVHGATFENELGKVISSQAQRFGDVYERTGNSTGLIKNCKVGDYVVELGADTQAPEARIVWEAKDDKSYDLKRALSELDTARKNRQAQIGIFVLSRKSAPEGLNHFNRNGNDLVIIWDEADQGSDVLIHAVYSVARALAVRKRAAGNKTEATTHEIECAVRAVEKHIKQLDDVETWVGTIENNSKKILERVRKMRESLADEIKQLDHNLFALKSDAPVQ